MPWRKIEKITLQETPASSLSVAAEFSEPGVPPTKFVFVKTTDLDSASSEFCDMGKKELGFVEKFRGDPFVVQCFGWDQSEEKGKTCFNLLLEYAPEGDLINLMEDHAGVLPENLIGYYTYMILKGLSSIHGQEVAHCDVKAENILVFKTEDGFTQVKLTDFGQSRYLKLSTDSLRYRGTAIYISPESVNHGIHGKSGDVWALGCTVLRMMLGGESIWGDSKISTKEVLKRIAIGAPAIPKSVSDVGRDFLKQCFVYEHERRPTVEMLLRHPFITENVKGMLPPNGFKGKVENPFGRRIASKDMFSTN